MLRQGRVKRHGRIGALLDLGAGFHSDLTGRENVFVTAIVAGLTRREVARSFQSIVEFAELETFIDSPVRTYSTGMQMRLAFAVAVHTRPDVLLVDEFLSVGDVAFQAKCLERIAQLKKQGCAIVLISQSAEQVQKLCDRALWLRQGQVVAYGEPEVVAGQYVSEMHAETLRRTPIRPPQLTRSGIELQVNQNRFGSQEIEITDVELRPGTEIKSGDPLEIVIGYRSPDPIAAPIFSVTLSHEDGQTCIDTNTAVMELTLPMVQGQGQITLQIDRLDLNHGRYFVDVGVHETNWNYAYDYHWHVYPLLVQSSIKSKGLVCPPQRWDVEEFQVSGFRTVH